MKKILALLPATLLTAWLGCGGGDQQIGTKNMGPKPAISEHPKGIIAYTPLTLSNPFFKVIGDHIKAEAKKNGYQFLSYGDAMIIV